MLKYSQIMLQQILTNTVSVISLLWNKVSAILSYRRDFVLCYSYSIYIKNSKFISNM